MGTNNFIHNSLHDDYTVVKIENLYGLGADNIVFNETYHIAEELSNQIKKLISKTFNDFNIKNLNLNIDDNISEEMTGKLNYDVDAWLYDYDHETCNFPKYKIVDGYYQGNEILLDNPNGIYEVLVKSLDDIIIDLEYDYEFKISNEDYNKIIDKFKNINDSIVNKTQYAMYNLAKIYKLDVISKDPHYLYTQELNNLINKYETEETKDYYNKNININELDDKINEDVIFNQNSINVHDLIHVNRHMNDYIEDLKHIQNNILKNNNLGDMYFNIINYDFFNNYVKNKLLESETTNIFEINNIILNELQEEVTKNERNVIDSILKYKLDENEENYTM